MIQLWDGWAIDTDEYQYILGIPKSRTLAGKDIVEMGKATYHTTLESALREFYRKQLRLSIGSNSYTLSQALVEASRIENQLRHILQQTQDPDFG